MRALVARELGAPPDEVFAAIEPEPFSTRLLEQFHEARLRDGEAVALHLVHPRALARAPLDLELLPLIAPALAGAGDAARIETAIADFAAGFETAIDLRARADGHRLVARDAADRPVVAPRVHDRLTSRRLMVFRALRGATLDHLYARSGYPEEMLARLVEKSVAAWLSLVLDGRPFPAEPWPENVLILDGGWLAFPSGPYALPGRDGAALGDYLAAAAAQAPDRACRCFLALSEPLAARTDAERDELYRRFRQAVPRAAAADDLAANLLLHWRLGAELGWRPRPPLAAFYRALQVLERTVTRFDPGRDVVAEAYAELHFAAGMRRLRETLDPRRLGEELRSYARLLAELPRRLETALTMLERGEVRLALEVAEPPRRRSRPALARVAAGGLALLALALVVHLLRDDPAFGVWAERLGAAGFLLLGAWLLKTLGSD